MVRNPDTFNPDDLEKPFRDLRDEGKSAGNAATELYKKVEGDVQRHLKTLQKELETYFKELAEAQKSIQSLVEDAARSKDEKKKLLFKEKLADATRTLEKLADKGPAKAAEAASKMAAACDVAVSINKLTKAYAREAAFFGARF